MSADILFEELGYVKSYEGEFIARYIGNSNTSYDLIVVGKKAGAMAIVDSKESRIELPELKAIAKKIEERGW